MRTPRRKRRAIQAPVGSQHPVAELLGNARQHGRARLQDMRSDLVGIDRDRALRAQKLGGRALAGPDASGDDDYFHVPSLTRRRRHAHPCVAVPQEDSGAGKHNCLSGPDCVHPSRCYSAAASSPASATSASAAASTASSAICLGLFGSFCRVLGDRFSFSCLGLCLFSDFLDDRSSLKRLVGSLLGVLGSYLFGSLDGGFDSLRSSTASPAASASRASAPRPLLPQTRRRSRS